MSGKKTSQIDKLLDNTDKEEKSKAQAAESAPAEPAQSSKDRTHSFLLGYAKRECGYIAIGMFFLVASILGMLAIPAFIGIIIDLLVVGDFEAINISCLYMLFIVTLSGLCAGYRAAMFNIL